MTPTRAALLRDVAKAIIESGYAARKPSRRWQIWIISQDVRLGCPKKSVDNTELINAVMNGCEVNRSNAKRLISMARKMRHETESQNVMGQD